MGNEKSKTGTDSTGKAIKMMYVIVRFVEEFLT